MSVPPEIEARWRVLLDALIDEAETFRRHAASPSTRSPGRWTDHAFRSASALPWRTASMNFAEVPK